MLLGFLQCKNSQLLKVAKIIINLFSLLINKLFEFLKINSLTHLLLIIRYIND
jgi:hypothetical protein